MSTASNARLIGTDVELIASTLLWGGTEEAAWFQWVQLLNSLPPKGERKDLGDTFWAHRDGLSAEYGFAPTTSLDQFMSRLQQGRILTADAVGVGLAAASTFDVSTIVEAPWAHSYLDLGCSPDYLATPRRGIVRRSVPPGTRRSSTRECGGHIHISLPQPYLDAPELMNQFVMELDDIIYPLAVGATNPDATSWYRRRKVFRPTPYGVEYRTLGADALLADNAEVYLSLLFDISRSVWEA